MAFDEDLAGRVRELIADEPELTERRMFGGLAFLVGGRIALAVSHRGGLMVRIEPDQTDAILAKAYTRPFEMRGKPLDGWVRVDAEGLKTKRQLERGAARGVGRVRRPT